MRCRSLIALLAAVATPTVTFPDDPAGGWSDGGSPDGYDVSVDLNVQGAVTFETFHDELQPYGDWVVVGSYGRVWRPRVAAGWRPYYYGRWEWTNEGWLWVSDEPWGWAAYHYGRWAYDPYFGWIWVPGYEWAPAWVSWRVSGDVIGWAPLAPGFSVYVSSYPFIDFWWTFVPCVRFVSVPVYTVAYAPGHARRWFYATAPAPARPPRGGRFGPAPTPAWGGPPPRHIELRIGRPVRPARIVRAPSPGERGRPGEIPVYRPERPGRDDRFPGRSFGRPSREERAAPSPSPGGNGRGPGPAAAPGWPGRRDRDHDRGREDGGRGGGVRPDPRGGGQPASPGARPDPRGGGQPASPGVRPDPRGGGQPASPGARPDPRGGGRPASPGARPDHRGAGQPASPPGVRPDSRGGGQPASPGARPDHRGAGQPASPPGVRPDSRGGGQPASPGGRMGRGGGDRGGGHRGGGRDGDHGSRGRFEGGRPR